MVDLAPIRRRMALFICPELREVPQRETVGFFDLEGAKGLPRARRASILDDLAAVAVPDASQDQSSASRPWEALQTQEQARAWLAEASEEELREMAGHLLGDRPLCRDQDALKQRILLAANASQGLWRRLMRAMAEEAGPRMRWRSPVGKTGRAT